ncbi:hypothetical protein M728_001296 [Ensifer sp. WSM1721]
MENLNGLVLYQPEMARPAAGRPANIAMIAS